jgi:hypothetical protein
MQQRTVAVESKEETHSTSLESQNLVTLEKCEKELN